MVNGENKPPRLHVATLLEREEVASLDELRHGPYGLVSRSSLIRSFVREGIQRHRAAKPAQSPRKGGANAAA
jgi:metal-responsive CopG/Arc/MetJ family transcriptional regulator